MSELITLLFLACIFPATAQNPIQNHLPINQFKLYEEKIVKISAYTPSIDECDSTPCISASGVNVCKKRGRWIACPRKYSFGTVVGFDNLNFYCVDRKNIKHDWGKIEEFDKLYYDRQEALNWGIKYKLIRIYEYN